MSRSSHRKTTNADGPIGGFRASRRSFLGVAATGALAVGAPWAIAHHAVAAQSGVDTRVLVYPPHDTRTASPNTEISFRGSTEDELGPVVVVGSETGAHSGILEPHADGNGVSYVPDAEFEPGERVTVRADVQIGPTEGGSLSFSVVRPATLPEATAGEPGNEPEVAPREFKSRPDLKPPVMEVATPANGAAPGDVFVSAKITHGQNGAMILDNAGEVIWFDTPAVTDYTVFDFRVQQYQDQPVLTWFEGPPPVTYGMGHYVICDTSYQRIAGFQVGNGYAGGGDLHEFLLTPRGTALVTIYHGVDWDLSPVDASRYGSVTDCIVQELEIESGRVLYEWHALDHIGLDETRITVDPDSERPFDYFHLNSVDEDPDGNFVISARHTFAVYKIDRRTNEVTWRLGGSQSDFTMGEGADFAWQHDARVHANGELSLFDNHDAVESHEETEASRGLILSLDEAAMSATFVREYVHPEEYLSGSQANLQLLPNGNAFIGWGSEPVFSEFSANGDLIFDCHFPEGGTSYRAYRHEWAGQPIDPPDIAVELSGQNAATVYASWNGATGVSTWHVIAGPTAEIMEVVGGAERDGFETAIAVDVVTGFYSVQALDAAGAVIGTAIAIQPGTAP